MTRKDDRKQYLLVRFGWKLLAIALVALGLVPTRGYSQATKKTAAFIPMATQTQANQLRMQMFPYATRQYKDEARNAQRDPGLMLSMQALLAVATSTSREEFHANVERLPITVVRRAGKQDGVDGTFTYITNRFGRTKTTFIPTTSSIGGVKSAFMSGLRAGSSGSADSSGSNGIRRLKFRAAKQEAELCDYNGEQIPCEFIDDSEFVGDYQEYEDGIVWQAAIDEESQPMIDEINADEAFIDWCNSYEIAPEGCPTEDSGGLTTTASSTFMSGPSVEKVDNEPFEFETVKFIAGPADHPECKRAKCLDALERAKDAVKDYLEARGANYIANLIVRDAALARVARTGTAEAVQTAIAGLRLSEFLVLAGEVGLGFAAFGIGFCIGSIFT